MTENPLQTDLELRQCPFCGSEAEGSEYRRDTGGGVSTFIARVRCSNKDCPPRPTTIAEGRDGYGRGERSDDAARLKAATDWNRRTI